METIGTGNKEQSIFAGMHGTLEYNDITIAQGEGMIKPGTCLGKITATGEYAVWDTSANDGRQNLAGIAGGYADATNSTAKTFLYVHGKFSKAKLTAKQIINPGIYLNGLIVITEEA